MKLGIERCGSPLEVAFARALAGLSRFEWRRPSDAEYEVGTWPGWWIALLAQPPVGPYRPDFVLGSTFPGDLDGPPWFIVVEVDGHEFHERTKEQARRDRSRDRFFATRDIRVLRFTGQEVWGDASGCAREVFELAMRLQQENVGPKLEDEIRRMWSNPTKRAELGEESPRGGE